MYHSHYGSPYLSGGGIAAFSITHIERIQIIFEDSNNFYEFTFRITHAVQAPS